MRAKTQVLALCCVTVLVPIARSQTVENSFVYIECEESDGRQSRGSGALIHETGYVLTAKHVAPDGATCHGAIGAGGTSPTRRLVRSRESSQYDALLLRFVPGPDEEFSFLSYAPPEKGAEIRAYGVPADSETGEVSVSGGVVSTNVPDSRGFLRTTAMSVRGMSGGPVVYRETNHLLGIVAGADFDSATGAPATYAILSIEELAADFPVLQKAQTEPAVVASPRPTVIDLPEKYKCNAGAAASNPTSCKAWANTYCNTIGYAGGEVLNPVPDQPGSPNFRGSQVACID